jgi:hypothetical protein
VPVRGELMGYAADGSLSGSTCQTALHFAQWQTVIVWRGTAVTSVEEQTGQTLQTVVAGMIARGASCHTSGCRAG